MTTWVEDEFNKRRVAREKQEHRDQVFGPAISHTFEKLLPLLQRDVADLNANFIDVLGDKIQLDSSSFTVGRIQITKNAIPAHYITVVRDVIGHAIKINRERADGNDRTKLEEEFMLDLDDDDAIHIKKPDGKEISIEQVSEFILRPILD